MDTLYLSREQARRVDQHAQAACGLSPAVLMENAGRACVDALLAVDASGPVLVCCGKGNNGGDGLVMVRHLLIRGIDVRTVLWGTENELAPQAAENYQILSRNGYHCQWVRNGAGGELLRATAAGAVWVVDALLGTGSLGIPRAPMSDVIRILNELPTRRFAVDLPSGLDANTGVAAEPTFCADHTCTMVALKLGFQHPQARKYLGKVQVVDIGVPWAWLFQATLPQN